MHIKLALDTRPYVCFAEGRLRVSGTVNSCCAGVVIAHRITVGIISTTGIRNTLSTHASHTVWSITSTITVFQAFHTRRSSDIT